MKNLKFPFHLAILLSLSVGLLFIRMNMKQNTCYMFLIWNLILAIIPYLISYLLHLKPRAWYINFVLIFNWLIFFPNAPYLITDFIHIHHSYSNIIWFDIVMLFMFSITGLWLAIKSLDNIHTWINSQISIFIGNIFILISIFLSSFGVYLGREERLNSWNIFTNPLQLFDTIFHLKSNIIAQEFTIIYSILTLGIYIVYRIEKQRMNKLKQLIR